MKVLYSISLWKWGLLQLKIKIKGQLPLLSRSQVYFYMLYSCWKPLNIVIFESNKKLDSFNRSSSLLRFSQTYEL